MGERKKRKELRERESGVYGRVLCVVCCVCVVRKMMCDDDDDDDYRVGVEEAVRCVIADKRKWGTFK